jgi:hypothetical protein
MTDQTDPDPNLTDIEAELANAEKAFADERRAFQSTVFACRVKSRGDADKALRSAKASLDRRRKDVEVCRAARDEARRLLAVAESETRAAAIRAMNTEIADLFDERVALACQIDGAMKSVVAKIKDIETLNDRIRTLRASARQAGSAGIELDNGSFRRRLGRYIGLWLARFDGLGNLGFWRGHGTTPTPLAVSEALGRDRIFVAMPDGAEHGE